MRTAQRIAPIILAVLLASGMAVAADRWLHVRVDPVSSDGEMVRVNVPLSLVTSVVPMIDEEEIKDGKVHLDREELAGIDLRKVLAELRNTPDSEFLTVRSAEESVRVAKEGDLFVVLVEGTGESAENVRVTVPLAVLDALLEEAEENVLDIARAVEALAGFEGDLVTVEDGDQFVRVWIDGSNSIEE